LRHRDTESERERERMSRERGRGRGREAEAEAEGEGEAGSLPSQEPGARCGARSQGPGITTWAEGRRPTI